MNIYLIIVIFLLIFLLLYVLFENDKYKNIEIDLKKKSATIVGTGRDIESFLPRTIKKLEMISSLFKNVNIIIYENDSIDNTLNILKNWKLKSTYNIQIISEKNIPGKRTHRLSNGRNILLEEALKINNEYYIVIDLDERIKSLRKNAFLSSFSYKNDWACLGANQYSYYYDLWALRTKDDWMNFDCIECLNNGLSEKFCLPYKILKPQEELIEVDSCFGGLAIYKTKYIKNCKYYGGSDEKEICEHVNFNNEIREKNKGKIFINTKMINC